MEKGTTETENSKSKPNLETCDQQLASVVLRDTRRLDQRDGGQKGLHSTVHVPSRGIGHLKHGEAMVDESGKEEREGPARGSSSQNQLVRNNDRISNH